MSEFTTGDLLVRDCEPEDFDTIVPLLQQLWPDRQLNLVSLKDSFLKSFQLEGHIIRVAAYGDQLVGLCTLSIRNNLKAEGNLANIDELVVENEMRGKQIGQLLLRDAERIARENGCKFIGLESSFHREDAHRFYEGNGYRKQGYYITRALD